jgi:hypothetical protein
MTPHGVLEDMARFPPHLLARCFDRDGWSKALGYLAEAVWFDYGNSAPLLTHAEFAQDMLGRGLFRLPFNTVFATANVIPHTAIIGRQHLDGSSLKRVSWFIVAPARIADMGEFMVPLMSGELIGDDLSDGIVNWRSLTTQRHASRKTGKPWDDETYQEGAEKAISFLLSSTTLLMSQDVETEIIPAPTKLNLQRQKKGRVEVGERRVVRIKKACRHAYTDAVERYKSSPRMHWRRGHFRRVREDLIVPVAPCIIGGNEAVRPIIKRYEVHK